MQFYGLADFDDFLPPEEPESKPVKNTSNAPGKIKEPGRNSYLTREGGKSRHIGRSEAAIEAELQVINKEKCDPPLEESEVRKIAKSISRYEPATAANPFSPQPYWQQYDIANINDWKCPPLEPIIDGILAKGNLCWLAAETQTGKTLFMLWVCLHLLHEGSLFEKFAITPVKRILYVACEDPARRFKSRLLDMAPSEIEPGRFVVYVAPGLSLADCLCFQFLEDMIREGDFDFVVIDTFQAATMGISSFDDEKLSIVIRRLLELTRKTGTTIVVNDHFRKTLNSKKRTDLDFNDVKGSGGKLQNADVFLLMDRQGGKLRISGKSKEWDTQIGFLLDVSQQGSPDEKFTYAGDLVQMGADMAAVGEQNKANVLAAFDFFEWRSRKQIAQILGISPSTVGKHTASLFNSGDLEQQGTGKTTKYRRVPSEVSDRSEDTPRSNTNKGLYDND
ncbi:MAG: AAA family ATPase [Acidobacteria bacterium]|nr:AAA family ATPase [Acidobacteriota bacterium]